MTDRDQTEQESPTLLDQARRWLTSHIKLRGARLILAILPESNANVNTKSGRRSAAHRCPLVEAGIPMSDYEALREYRQRCDDLMRGIKSDLELGFAERAAARQYEFDAIQEHIREITMPGGRIRNFPSGQTREYQRQFQDYRYLLSKAEADNKAVFHYLKEHVITGAEFVWRQDHTGNQKC